MSVDLKEEKNQVILELKIIHVSMFRLSVLKSVSLTVIAFFFFFTYAYAYS